MKKLIASIAILALASLAGAEPRTWTAADGRTVEAEYVSVSGQRVILKVSGRGNIPFPISGLSEADRQWVAEKVKEEAAKMAAQTPTTSSSTASSETGAAGTVKDFIGRWEGFMADSDGSPQGRMNLEITEDTVTATNPGGQMMGAGTYKLRGGDKVMRIDTEGTAGQYEGKSYEGIVTIEGKTMKWCSANDNPSARRPSDMKTDPRQNQFLMIMEKK